MYVLFVMFISGIIPDVEESQGKFPDIESCWEAATTIASDPNVFSVRCTLAE